MKKRKLLYAITAALIATGLNYSDIPLQTVNAVESSSGYSEGFFYQKIDEDYDNVYDYIKITDCDETAIYIDIPSELEKIPVISIGEYAFNDCVNLKEVKIADSVINIGGYAFNGCTGLEKVTLSNNLKEMGTWAFGNCQALTDIKLPASLQKMGDSAFNFCSALESIVIPKNVAQIGERAFANCTALKNVTVSEGVTSISAKAFYGCTGIKEITVPMSVKDIGESAFAYCEMLEAITIENPECNISECIDLYDTGGTISNGWDENNGIYYYFNGTIYGYDNSTALVFAKKYGYDFSSLGEASNGKIGDSNGDGIVNVRDAANIASLLAKGKSELLPASADYNNDGKINVRDAAAIAAMLAKS